MRNHGLGILNVRTSKGCVSVQVGKHLLGINIHMVMCDYCILMGYYRL